MTETPQPKTSKLSTGAIIIIGLLAVIMLIVILIGSSITNVVRGTFLPIQQANASLSTQVSQLLHPTPTVIPDPVSIVHEVRTLARLETIQYTVEKVITAEVNQGVLGPLFGDKLLLVAHGYVIAGVDLGKLQAEDLWLEGDTLHARLPQAEVFVATLNNEQSYIYDRTTGILTKGKAELETTARQVAEQEILRTAEEDGILEQAQANAEAYMLSLLMKLGYEKVAFEPPN